MKFFQDEIKLAHCSWHAILEQALAALERDWPGYLVELSRSSFLPTSGRIFAAFSQPLDQVNYILVGEGPYPREQSATGYCFMDGAVGALWSSELGGGLSKAVNRATSLRNFMKMLLLAEGHLQADQLNPQQIAEFSSKARSHGSPVVQTMAELQNNFLRAGFLMLNASLVFREDVAPAKDAKVWLSFLRVVVSLFAQEVSSLPDSRKPCFILWGKIADKCLQLPELADDGVFLVAQSEHPYNLSFISNTDMQTLFGGLRLLMRAPAN